MYTGFAEVYDEFMDNVPYDEWVEYLKGLLYENGIKSGTVAELACGTGNVTKRLGELGYDMIGIDNSEEMLTVASGKLYENEDERGVIYTCQDMREFELPERVRAVVCICDGLNYILKKSELVKVFRRVSESLDTDGVFIFDLNTIYKYEEVIGERTIAENRENMSFIWDNYFDGDERINEYDLTIYVENEKGSGNYIRFDETHFQKGYTVEEIMETLREGGFRAKGVYDAFTNNRPDEKSERIYFVAKRQ